MEKPLFAALGLRLVCVISLPCPTCGSELAFLEQYQRHYCYACGNYAPEGYGDRGAKICPTCRGILSYVAVRPPVLLPMQRVPGGRRGHSIARSHDAGRRSACARNNRARRCRDGTRDDRTGREAGRG